MNRRRAEGLTRSTLSMRLAEVLKKKILDGSAPQGSILDETLLSQYYQVSRSVVRDAISKLVGLGLVQKQPHRPAQVRVFRPKDVSDVFDLRLILELGVVNMASFTESDLEQLSELLHEEEEAIKEADVGNYIAVDSEFHQCLVSCSNNQAIIDVFQLIVEQLQVARLVMTTRTPSRMIRAAREHNELLEHLRRGTREQALDVLRVHIVSAKEDTLKWFDEIGNEADDLGLEAGPPPFLLETSNE